MQKLRILIYEDSSVDVALIKNAFASTDYKVHWESASDRINLVSSIENFHPDLIISDYEVPGFNGLQVIELVKSRRINIPVIIVSGSHTNKLSERCLEAGAYDFLQKDLLQKLPFLIRNLFGMGKEVGLKENYSESGHSSSLNYSMYEILFNSLNDGILLYTPDKLKLVDVNLSVSEMYGYSREEFLKLSFEDITASDKGFSASEAKEHARKAIIGEPILQKWLAKAKNGTTFWIQVSLKLIKIGDTEYLMAIIKNIDNEIKFKESLELIKSHFESLAQNSPDIIMRFDRELRHLYVNEAINKQLGLDPILFIGKTHEEMGVFPDHMCKFWEKSIQRVFKTKKSNLVNFSIESPKGTLNIEWRLFPEYTKEGKIETVLGIARDITDRLRTDKIQRVLFEIATAANTTKNLEELFLTIQSSLNTIIDTKNCYVALYDDENDVITLPFHKDEKDNFQEFPAGKTTTGYVIKTGKSQLLDTSKIEKLEREGEIEPIGAPSVSWLGVPLKISEKIIGVFVVQSYNESILYTEDDVQLLEFVSDQIARAIERKIDQDNLKYNERRQRMILESSPDGLVVIGLQGEILETNSKFYELTNSDSQSIKDKKFFDFILDEDVIKVQNILNETLVSGYSKNIEFRIIKPDNNFFFAEASLGLISGDENLEDTFVIVVKDINDRKENEHNLKVAKDKAEESDRLKTAFLSNMSHEIRTPMNAIVGFAELLSHSSGKAEDNQEFVTQINQAAGSLLRLIDDIIDISKIEAGQLVIQASEFQVSPLLNELKPLFENALKRVMKEHISILEVNPFKGDGIAIIADEFRLKQVFINLVTNAIKFTEEGRISYGIKSINSNVIEFFVKDTGVGIAQNMQEQIFERFRQGHENEKHFYGGTGLGLAISKNLIEKMGGTIGVKSAEGSGSEFYFTLPCCSNSKIRESANPEKQESMMKWENKTILIAEDEDSNYALLFEILKRTKVKIIRALNGEEALGLIRKNKDIDLILMDVHMPGISGYEVTREIRRLEIKTPIIAQTAYAMAGEEEISISEGCNDYISKPIRAQELFQLIGKYLDPDA